MTPLVLANITSLIFVKLDEDNYLLWLGQFEPLLHCNDLYRLVDGFDPCTDRFLKNSEGKLSTTINPTYTTWRKCDQMLIGWIMATFTEPILTQVIRLNNSYEIWKSLALQYSTRSRSRKAQLHHQIQTLKKGTSTITKYLNRAKILADSLAAIGSPVLEDYLVLIILRGLPKEYDALLIPQALMNYMD